MKMGPHHSIICRLRLIGHGGAPCPIDIKRQMIEWWGPIFMEIYGSSEGLATTAATSAEWLRHPGTVGRPLPGAEIRILDDDGRELPNGEVGNIYLRPYTQERFEYFRDSVKTESAYHGELFTVGDLGYVNDQGYLFICDRKVDMIITGGTKVYSAEVERILVLHPAVADCAVLGVPHPVLGESVHAVVQPVSDAQPGSKLSADILRFLSLHLSAEKIPINIEYMQQLPRDPAGKLFKRRLRKHTDQ